MFFSSVLWFGPALFARSFYFTLFVRLFFGWRCALRGCAYNPYSVSRLAYGLHEVARLACGAFNVTDIQSQKVFLIAERRRKLSRDRVIGRPGSAQLHRDVSTKALFCARDCDLVDNCLFGPLFNGREKPFLTDFKRYLSVAYPFIRRVIHNCTQLFYALSEKRRFLTYYILYLLYT